MKIIWEPNQSYLSEISVSYHPKKMAKTQISSAQSAYDVLKELFDPGLIQLREEFIILLLNRANYVIGWHRISTGGISGTVVDPKLIFGIALKTAASSIILSHNHPSGNLKPSQSDRTLTEKIKKGCTLLDLMILDHIIITSEKYLSFSDEGYL
jgi:DNA repair protein RadC